MKNSKKPLPAQTEEFMFQNVAYRPTVYKTGVGSSLFDDLIFPPLKKFIARQISEM